MKNKIIFENLILNYFKDSKKKLYSELVILRLGEVLGDDIIYGTIKKGCKYLTKKIDQKYLENHVYDLEQLPGKTIIGKLDDLIESEINLFLEKEYKNKQLQLNKKLSNQNLLSEDEIFLKKLIKDCNYNLKDKDKVCIDGKKYNSKKLTVYQKLSFILENTNNSIKEYSKTNEEIYTTIIKQIDDKLKGGNHLVKKIQPK